MKTHVLLVNCYRENAGEKIRSYREWLAAAAARAGVELEATSAADVDEAALGRAADAVIVSGSQKMVGDGEADAGLLRFLAAERRPLLGVCYGHQVLARAFGAEVKRDVQKHQGDEEIFVNKTDPLFLAFPPVFRMAESHEEIVLRDSGLERSFMVLAESRQGLVEAIRHRDHPLYGVQFHPEKSGELGIRLLVNFLNIILNAK